MNARIARKILRHSAESKRFRRRLEQLYPPRMWLGRTIYPSWHEYYRFQKAWTIVHRKIREYGDKFKLL